MATRAAVVPAEPADVVLSGTDLLPPVWDFADRIWVVDRTTSGAVVHVVVDGVDRVVDVTGVSGREVVSFLVSRDGTRFVAVVRDRDGDQLRVGRVEVDGLGSLIQVRSTEAIEVDPSPSLRIKDIAWTSPTTLALLTPLRPTRSTPCAPSASTAPRAAPSRCRPRCPARSIGLAGTPVEGQPLFAVTPDNIVDLTDGAPYGFVGDPATSVSYAGS